MAPAPFEMALFAMSRVTLSDKQLAAGVRFNCDE